MRFELQAETDTSSLLLFDPAAIPESLDRASLDEGDETLDRLDRRGLLCLFPTNGTGVRTLRLLVNEPLPESLRPYARRLRFVQSLPIPSGRCLFAGLEYALRGESPLLKDHPNPGSSATLDAGYYRLELYRMIYPEDLPWQRFRAEATLPERLAWASMKVLIPLSIAAWIGLVVIYFTKVRVPLPELAAPILGTLFVLPFVVRRLEPFTSARDRFERLSRELPAFVAVLHPSSRSV